MLVIISNSQMPVDSVLESFDATGNQSVQTRPIDAFA